MSVSNIGNLSKIQQFCVGFSNGKKIKIKSGPDFE
jgi:hypothetical protein